MKYLFHEVNAKNEKEETSLFLLFLLFLLFWYYGHAAETAPPFQLHFNCLDFVAKLKNNSLTEQKKPERAVLF